LPLDKKYFTAAPETLDGTIVDIRDGEMTFTDKVSGEEKTEPRFFVEIAAIKGNFSRNVPFSSKNPTHRNSKWMKWLKMFKAVGVKVGSADDLIGKSFKFEITSMPMGDFEAEFYIPKVVYSEEDVAKMKVAVKPSDLTEVEGRAMALVNTVAPSEMPWDQFLMKVSSAVSEDPQVWELVSKKELLNTLPGVAVKENTVSVVPF
jgi:hypothetical protein